MKRTLLTLGWWLTYAALARPIHAQVPAPVPAPAEAQEGQDESSSMLTLRVSGTSQGAIIMVDRGFRDGLAVGDLVRFQPRTGPRLTGKVVRVRERSAMVELDDEKTIPEVGTRGEVRLTTGRRVAPTPLPPNEEAREVVPEHPPWENQDEAYSEDMPLLVEVEAVDPKDRAPRTTGRIYVFGDAIGTINEDRTDVFLRIGTDVVRSNPFGYGGELALDAETSYRDTDVPDQGGRNEGEVRVDRLSYRQGGTRFEGARWEVGRFLQYGMPELGVVDGYEYSRSLVGGAGYGVSVGFMPEPDQDFQSGKDFQVAAWYHWEPEEFESLSIDGAVQKTLHNGNADRDLLVLRVENRPSKGWDFNGTAWVDLYTGGDHKDAGLELTELRAVASRRFEKSGVDVDFTLLRFPDIERFEFLPPDPADLVDNELRRLGVRWWRQLLDSVRFVADAGLWDDEDDAGGDLELAVELDGMLFERDFASLSIFDNHAQFMDVVGARLSYRYAGDYLHWDVLGEAARQRQHDFTDVLDDLPRYRARAGLGFRTGGGWDLSVYGEGESWEDDEAWSVGFQAQRSF